MSLSTDLNCDVGESFGAYRLGCDAAILDYVTSANIACGFHAGDPATMRSTVKLAIEKGVAIGAHPGFADQVGFGRREMKISPQEAKELVLYQIGALDAFVKSEGGMMRHVKPHGALYNMAARNYELATAIAEAVHSYNPGLILVGQSGSQSVIAGKSVGLRTASEVFADRGYEPDGSLTPRSQPDSVITNVEQAVRQVIGMIQTGRALTHHQTEVPVHAETVCLHGDGQHALEFARQIRAALNRAGIVVRAI